MKLIPLRIPSGWLVCYNELFEWSSNHFISRNHENLSSKQLLLTHKYWKFIVDVGWYPESKPEGEFCLLLVKQEDIDIHHLAYWNEPLFIYKTKEVSEITEAINDLLETIQQSKGVFPPSA